MKLYSDEYAKILIEKHKSYKWGGSVRSKISEILYIMDLLNNYNVLDYGCGYGFF